MPIAAFQHNPSPFDAVAASYDRTFTHRPIGQAQRKVVWTELERAFHWGDRVLEIGCGTGVDACFLADRGVEVVACDSSSRMIAVTAHKVAVRRLKHVVRPHLLAAEEIGRLRSRHPFDGAFSNFGALNCVTGLKELAENLALLLRGGAPLLLCVMGPCCLWEIAWYLGQRNPRKAFRRLRSGKIVAQVGSGMPVQVQYPTVGSLERIFSPHFRLRSIRGVGVAVPPSYAESWVNRFPRLFELAVRADTQLGRLPGARLLADHILLRFDRRPV